MVSVGKLIEAEMKRQGRSVTWLAGKLYCDRTNIYKMYKKDTLDSGTIYRISELLGVDFFRLLSEEMRREKLRQRMEGYDAG